MTATIKKSGNTAAVEIPLQILHQANLKEGTDVAIFLTNEGEITLRAIRKRTSIQELFAGYDGGLYQSDELDWGKPQGGEIW